jgi:putative ABC transport system permease protein
MSSLSSDLRQAFRALLHSRRFTILAFATLAMSIGATCALWTVVDGVLRSLLDGVGAGDLPTFAAVSRILAAATVLASSLPARRATRVDPIEALRAD